MQRIYLPDTEFSETLTISDTELYHQFTRVLRSRVWDEMIFFDGKKKEDHLYKVFEIDKKQVVFEKLKVLKKKWEISPKLSLYQALPNKLSKIEYIIQKCSEVGYRNMVFFQSEHSQKLVLSDAKKERLQRIAIEAIEQCGGNTIPTLTFGEDIVDLPSSKNILTVVCDPTSKAQQISKISLKGYSKVHVFVGPEWGFSEEELLACNKRGFHRISLWERILRCETVGEVVWFFIAQKK